MAEADPMVTKKADAAVRTTEARNFMVRRRSRDSGQVYVRTIRIQGGGAHRCKNGDRSAGLAMQNLKIPLPFYIVRIQPST